MHLSLFLSSGLRELLDRDLNSVRVAHVLNEPDYALTFGGAAFDVIHLLGGMAGDW